MFTPISFTERGAKPFGSTKEMVETLNSADLPGQEIEANYDKPYFVTVAQADVLGLQD